MRVMLLQPPLLPAAEVTPPLGLTTLASWLMARGHETRILDLDLEVRERDSAAEDRYVPLFERAVADFEPDVCAVTSMYSNSLQAEHLVRAAKRRQPEMVTVAGGAHFGALGPAALRRMPELDFAIQGEGEPALSGLLEVLAAGGSWKGVPSLCYREDGEIRTNAAVDQIDLSTLPPMWSTLGDALHLDRYVRTIPEGSARRVIYIEAGRGCPFACTFCATAPFWRRKFRVKPAERIVEEIRFLHEVHGYDSFMLVHDLLTVSPKFMAEFCDVMLAARLPVEWMANSRTDIRLKGLLPKMKAAGCWKLFFGVESASARVQKMIDKHLDPKDAETTVAELSQHGISCTCSFVLGQPEEWAEELSATVALGARLKLLGAEMVQFHRLRMWPPAPITTSGSLPVDFDLDSLRIEYPFPQVPEDHVDAIRSDNAFFSGYFVPETTAGSPSQLAQVEMFFHHAVTMAPYTVAALGQLTHGRLVPAFYEALSAKGPLKREELSWDPSGRADENWRILRPLFLALISDHSGLSDEDKTLVLGLFGYEEWRLHFVSGVPAPVPAAAAGANWSAFLSPLDIAQAVERLRAGDELSGDLLEPGILILAREAAGGFASYELDADQLPELNQPDSELVRTLSAVN
ncbi:MAG: cobalamin-dependent protein [Acidobacteriota bacterium]|nr:cobalamin-dependent protein [Acidobacteriota bacterium]